MPASILEGDCALLAAVVTSGPVTPPSRPSHAFAEVARVPGANDGVPHVRTARGHRWS